MNAQKILKLVILSFVFLLLVVIVFFGVQWFSNSVNSMIIHKNIFSPASLETVTDNASASTCAAPAPAASQNVLPERNWQIPDATLNATAAISIEVGGNNQKTLFESNGTEKLPIASLTKLMTTLVVLQNYNLSQLVTVDAAAMSEEGAQGDLQLGQVLTVQDLLYITLMESSNRSAYALAEVMGVDNFIKAMNANAQNMGLTDTQFTDVAGLDSGSSSTAEDLAKLTQYLFDNYPLFKEIIGLKQYNLYLPDGTFHHTLINTNELLGQDNIIGGKTGFTDDAQGCLMTIETSPTAGDYMINIVLGSPDRFGQMQKMIEWVNSAYVWQ